MDSIFGLVAKKGYTFDHSWGNQILKEFERFTSFKDTAIQNFNWGFMGFGRILEEKSSSKIIHSTSDRNLFLAGDIYLTHTDELIRKLNLPKSTALSDYELILKAYQKWQGMCVEHLYGEFAFIIWDKNKKRWFGARDRMGIKPLFYYNGESYTAFGTEYRPLLNLPFISQEVDSQWTLDFILGNYLNSERTFYKAIKALPPSHAFVLKGDRFETYRYWDFDLDNYNISLKNPEDYVVAFNKHFEKAIRQRLPEKLNVGAELSGGLDSSGITAVAHQYLRKEGRRIVPFGHAAPDISAKSKYYGTDERDRIEQVVQFLGIEKMNYITGVNHSIQEMHDYAFCLGNGIPHLPIALYFQPLYKKARELNVPVLLSGLGGDQVASFRGLTSYRLAMIDQHKWKTLTDELYRDESLALPKFFYRFNKLLIQRYAPNLYIKLSSSNRTLNEVLCENEQIVDTFIDVASDYCQDIFNLNWKSRIDIMENHFFSMIYKKMPLAQINQITGPHIPYRLQSCNIMARTHGIAYRYPLLDVPLIQFCLSIPPSVFFLHNNKRSLFKKALSGRLPENIVNQNKPSCWLIPWLLQKYMENGSERSGIKNDPGAVETRFYYSTEDLFSQLKIKFLSHVL